jgi:predicted DNA-binding transcriptional regulator AlpA
MSSAIVADVKMSVAQAAHHLGVSERWLYAHTPKRGGPPRVVLGPRTIHYYKSDLDAWRDSRRETE